MVGFSATALAEAMKKFFMAKDVYRIKDHKVIKSRISFIVLDINSK